jgi:hypothetical protein
VREVGGDLLAPPGVVSERDDVGAAREQAFGELRGDADTVCDVLAVDDAERRADLLAQGCEPVLERLAAGPADDVRDEEDVQGSDPAAG